MSEMKLDAEAAREAQLRDSMVEHYHQSFELAYRIWEKRNAAYGFAVAAFFLTAVVSINLAESFGFLLALFTEHDFQKSTEFIRSFDLKSGSIFLPMTQFSLDLVSIYFLSILYSRETHLNMMYDFVDDMEDNLRNLFELDETCVAFTRESSYYRRHTPGGMARFLNFLFTSALTVVVFTAITLKFSPIYASVANGPSDDWMTATNAISVASAAIALIVLGAYLRLKTFGHRVSEAT